MAQTTTDTAASTVSGAGAASSFSGGTGTEAEFGSLGALSPTWWEPQRDERFTRSGRGA